jgi:hypothetical protein
MTSKHGARTIHYEFHQIYRFSACTVIVLVNLTHLILPQGISFITNPHPTLQGISLRTNLHPTLQRISPITNLHPRLPGVKSNSQTKQTIDIYFKMELTPDKDVREYHDYRFDF